MAPQSKTTRPVFQKFARNDKSRPRRLATQLCPKSDKRYVLWKDVQTAYNDVDYLKVDDNRAVFMTDESSNIILPLRVPFSKRTYEVIAIDSSDQSDYSNSSGTEDDYDYDYKDTDEEGQEPMPPRVQQLFVATRKHHRMSAKNIVKKRDVFLERLTNARYWSSALRDKMDECLKAGALTEKNIARKDKMLAKIDQLEQKRSEWDYKNLCFHASRQLPIYVFSPASNKFLVLPSDLATWDDADPLTHSFRCYFICEIRKYSNTNSKQFHLVDHPGYDIDHQDEFFERYGGHSLRILQMIHQGYSDDKIEIPPLDTFKILWGSTTETPAHGLSKDNIKDLVAKSIDYLKRLPPPKMKERLYFSNNDIGEIRGFLSIPENDNGRGSMYRYTDKSEGSVWICRSHLDELLDLDAEENLQKFVEAHGGSVSLEWSQVNVVLGSESEANEFIQLLKKSKSCLLPSIKLAWPATRQFLRAFLKSLDNAATLCLELDGVMLDVQPHNSLEYKSNIFLDSPLVLLTLFNFPQPGEQCTYMGATDGFQVQSRMDENCPPFCWIERCLEFYMADGSKYDDGMDYGSSDSDDSDSDDDDKIKEILEKEEDHFGKVHKMATFMGEGLPLPSKITGISGSRAETVTLQTGLIDMHLRGDLIPVLGPDKGRSVRQLTVEAAVPLFEPEFEDLVHCCTRLEEVNVVVHEAHLALIVEYLARHWRGDSGSLVVTLFERPVDEDEKSRILVQVSVGGRTVRHGGPALDREVHTLQPGTDSTSLDNVAFKEIKCDQWNNDTVKTPLTPLQAELLDSMTATSALSLTNFKLDIHDRANDTLVTLQNILRRSRIGYLRISCKPIEAHLHDMALQVLLSIEWSSVNILVLTGQCVEHWIHLLGQVCTQGKDGGPRPLYLAIENTKVPPQPLSHSDALALHQLIYSSPLEELHMSNIEFSHDQDRQLVLGAVGADVAVTMKEVRKSE